MKTFLRIVNVTLVLTLGLIVPGCGGQRLVTVHIEKEGKLLLQGLRGFPDSWSTGQIWHSLDRMVFEPAPEAAKIEAVEQAKLSGDIRIKLMHVNNTMASAKVKSLILRRSGKGKKEWRIPRAELARTAKAAGL